MTLHTSAPGMTGVFRVMERNDKPAEKPGRKAQEAKAVRRQASPAADDHSHFNDAKENEHVGKKMETVIRNPYGAQRDAGVHCKRICSELRFERW